MLEKQFGLSKDQKRAEADRVVNQGAKNDMLGFDDAISQDAYLAEKYADTPEDSFDILDQKDKQTTILSGNGNSYEAELEVGPLIEKMAAEHDRKFEEVANAEAQSKFKEYERLVKKYKIEMELNRQVAILRLELLKKKQLHSQESSIGLAGRRFQLENCIKFRACFPEEDGNEEDQYPYQKKYIQDIVRADASKKSQLRKAKIIDGIKTILTLGVFKGFVSSYGKEHSVLDDVAQQMAEKECAEVDARLVQRRERETEFSKDESSIRLKKNELDAILKERGGTEEFKKLVELHHEVFELIEKQKSLESAILRN